jgi:hypothetical protein
MEARDAYARVFLNPAFCRMHDSLGRASTSCDGNPLADVKLLQDVKFVMKAGTVYKTSER